MSLSLVWKQRIVIVFGILALLKGLEGLANIFRVYTSNANPLIPDYLSHHSSFPYYFIIPVWGFLAYLGYWLYKDVDKLQKYVIHYLIAIAAFFFLEVHFYLLIQSLSPYST